MLSPEQSRQALTRLFRRQRIADVQTLSAALETSSRMSVFRRLSALGYLTSYSHAGRYYTLRDIPQFDRDGLWQYQGLCFSRDGSLKATVDRLVEEAEAGRTHHELRVRLQVRVHNTLLDLVENRRIGREPIGGYYLYVSANPARAGSQLALRRQQQEGFAKPMPETPASILIEVLLDLIQSAKVRPDADRVAERLAARGLPVTVDQVEAIFSSYGLKKTAHSRSRRSRY
ncbi:MAG: hypothetical protein ACRDFW_03975 [bacterium]